MEEKLLDLLVDICGDDIVRESLDLDMFEADLIDSLDFAELLYAIEENFGVIIAPSEVERSDINTPNKLIRLVRGRMEQ